MEDYEDGDDYPEDDCELHEEHQFAPCPECGAEMHVEAEMCPDCGYWLSTAERHALWDSGSSSLLSTGKFFLVVLLVVLFLGSMLGMIR